MDSCILRKINQWLWVSVGISPTQVIGLLKRLKRLCCELNWNWVFLSECFVWWEGKWVMRISTRREQKRIHSHGCLHYLYGDLELQSDPFLDLQSDPLKLQWYTTSKLELHTTSKVWNETNPKLETPQSKPHQNKINSNQSNLSLTFYHGDWNPT